ncbi:unnamed protein product [Bemisia tabaci]|uniref:Ammonium transporter n=1 Tax=Bemisia tabaci TaxID=7038 RepID=A0A9P0F2E1_BEMTA|nr:unnamed protein product [Bemisia tabaci]
MNESSTSESGGIYDFSSEDAAWILTSAFIIFTMQTGFGLLELGCVAPKNEVNIMMKNLVDIFLGGITYWLFGYALSFGRSELNTPFVALGDFALNIDNADPQKGAIYTFFVFQLSFATTATTIVSGAVAERCGFKAYCLFSLINNIVYCLPAGWVWGEHGFLSKMGAVDIAGSSVVHLTGGVTALAAVIMLGPRIGRYELGIEPLPLGKPSSCAQGLFVLWWGWLAFNSGSTYGVTNGKIDYAAKAAAMTMISSFGGGTVGLLYSFHTQNGRCSMMDVVNSVLGALVAVTAGCFLYQSWEALLVGAIGGLLVAYSVPFFDRLNIDDPVGASSVHGVCGMWGTLAVGLFAENPLPLTTTYGRSGLFRGGGWTLFFVQSLTVISIAVWSFFSTIVLLWVVNKIFPLRLEAYQEIRGADYYEHGIEDSSTEKTAKSKGRIYLEELDFLLKRTKDLKFGGNLRVTPQKSGDPKNQRKISSNNKFFRSKFRRKIVNGTDAPPIDPYGNDFNFNTPIAWIN